MITRQELYEIYKILDNQEKTLWATEANYSTYHGLYRYLNGQGSAYARVIKAAIKVLGEERFNELLNMVRQRQGSNTKKTSSEDQEVVERSSSIISKFVTLIDEAMRTSNIEELERLIQIIPELQQRLEQHIDTLKYLERLKNN